MKNNKEKTAKEKKFAKSLVAGAVGVTSLIAMVSFTGCGEDKNKEPGAFTVSISSELEGFEGRDITVNKGTKIKDLKSMFVSPVKGYQVAGFFSDFLCTKEYDDEELVDENTKIFIKFVIETYTVRVYGERRNANPELLCDPITVNYNEFAVVETPTKESDERGTYKFAGWEDINGNPVDLSTLKITEDIDVYATFVLDQQAEYSIGVIPKGVTVTRGGDQTSIVESNTKLAYGERVKITYELSEGHRFIDFSVTGADEVAGANNWYEVHGDVKIVFEQEAIKYVVGDIPEQVKIFRITKTEDGEQREAISSGSEVTHGDILDITHVPTVGKHKTKLDVSGIFPLGGEQFGVSVTGNITIDYEEDWNTAIVKLFNDDKKELLLGKTVKHGEGVEAETPTKPSNPLDYTNVFTCWVDEDGKPFDISKIELPTYDEKNPEPVINVYASYRKEYVYYDVSIPANVTVTNDGVKLGAGDKVNYGDELIITYKEDIGKHKNVFTVNGESKENSDIFVVTGNVNIVYEQKLNTATFKFDTGSEIVEVEVEHGKNVAVPTDPTKAADNTYTYSFAGWVDKAGRSVNFENVSVLSNESVVEVYASYSSSYIEYTIGAIPANVTIKKGETKLSSADTLHYDDEITVTYEETVGFDMSNFAVNGATRQGETNTYKVTGNVSVAYSEVYETYSVLNVPTGVTVVRESDSKSLKAGDTITFNDKLTISYSLTEGHHLKTFAVNGTAYETNDVKLSVAGELSVEFVEEINKYTVVFKNYDGTKLDEVIVDFGAAASTTVAATKDRTAKYTYTFAGWVDSEGSTVSLDAITENKEVFASFAETLNDYNLSLTGDVSVVRDGKVLTAADSIHIDDVLTLTYTEQTGYHKTSFTVNGTECVNGVTYTVVGDTTVVYAEEKNEATYIFYVEGTVVKSISAKHGENVELPTTPTKNADTKYTYVFDNWCDETLSNVVKLSDISVLINGSTVKVYARFVENYIDYSVSVSNENRITVTDSKGNVLSADSKVHVDDVLTITYSLSEGHHMTNFTVSGATRQGETNNYIVTGTVNVVYSEDIDTFKVVFMDYDKTTKLDEITVNWGTAASITAPTRVQDERYTYEFRAWTDADGKDVDLSSVKEAVTVYAAYSSTLREYTIAAIPANVTIKKGEKVLSSTDTLHYDDEITVTYEETAGFDMSNFAVNGATRQGETNTYKVIGNVSVAYSEVYETYSVLSVPAGVTVIRESDSKSLKAGDAITFNDKLTISYILSDGHHLVDFTVNGTAYETNDVKLTVTGDLTVEFEEEINLYNVRFYDDDKSFIEGVEVEWNKAATTTEVPTKNSDATYTYEFANWVDADGNVVLLDHVKSNMNVYASYSKTYIEYTISILKGIGNVSITKGGKPLSIDDTVHFGDTIVISYKESVGYHEDLFEINNRMSANNVEFVVDGNVEISYQEEANMATYHFYDDGRVYDSVTVRHGENVELPANPTKDADGTYTYEFVRWLAANKKDAAVLENVQVLADGSEVCVYSDYKATYIEYTIEIPEYVTVKKNGKVITSEDTLHFNEEIVISYNLRQGYHVKNFTLNGTLIKTNNFVTQVTSNMTIVFEDEINTYEVVFKDENKTTILGNATVNYNAAAALETVPTKDSDDIYDYTFAGWVDAEGNAVSLEHVKANTTVYASYSSTYIEYSIVIPSNVTVTKGGKTISSTDTLHYGDKIVVLYSESTGYHKTSFKINGTEQTANGVEFSVVGNTTISYEEAKNTATVIFVSEGEQYATASVKHGENVTLPTNPTKSADSTYTYEFAGWLGSDGNAATLENVQVLSDGSTFTVTAKFNPVYIDYSLTIPSGVSVSDAEGNVLENGETLHFGDEIIVSYTEKTGFHKTVFTVNGESKNNGDKIVVDGATTIVYEQSENTATYKFISGGKVISSVNVKHGQNVTVPAKPTKAADNIYTYEFENWYLEEVSDPNEPNKPRPLSDIDFENVSVLQDQSVVNIYACFEKTYIEYSLTIPSGVKVLKGGKELSRTDTLHYGDKITVSYEENTGFHKTVFTVNGENKNSGDEVVVSGNTTIVFNQTENQATYKFFADGKLVSSTTVLHGGNVEAPIVQKTADSKYTYGNYGWSLTEQEELCTAEYAEQNPLPAVNFENISVETDGAEVVYYMHFYTVFVEYSVSIVDEAPANVVVKKGDEVVDANTVLHFDDVITITCTSSEGHETTKFVVNGATDLGDGTYKVTGNVSIEYTEDYKSFAIVVPENVTVLRNDEAVTSDSIIRYNDELVISYTPSEGHHMTTFTVNGETFTNGGTLVVSGNITIVYAEAINTYTVTFMNEDRTETLGEVTVDYNTAATFAAPEKPTNIPYSYTFTGWVDAEGNAVSLENIKADITVSPAYETVNMYPYLQFSQIGDTYAVSGIKLDGYTDYVIPATYLGNPVTEISDMAFYGFDNIKSITIPDSITWIGSEAIRSCNSLEAVTFLGTIDDWAQIEISDCTSLRQAKLLIGGVEVKDVVLTSATKITEAFTGRNITSIKIPSTVLKIDNRAFQGCTSLASVTVDSSSIYSKLAAGENCGYLVDNTIRLKILASIDDGSNEYVVDNFVKVATADGYNEYVSAEYLFVLEESDASYKITGVKDNTVSEIQIPNCLRGKPISEIGAFAFSDCNKLAAVTLSKNIKVVGEGAFEGCNRITEVNYLGTISSWANISFGSENANPIYYSQKLSINGVEVVGDITISGVASISNYAFYNCKNIRGLTIAGIVTQTSIGNSAFIYCTDLEYVEMSGVSTIGANAFAGCTKLAEIVVDGDISSVGNNAFNGCNSLTNVTIGSAAIYGALTSADACGGLIKNATHIKVSKTADAGTNEYLLGNFVKTDSDDYFEYVSADEVLVFTAVEGGGYTVSGLKEGVTVENITIPATYNNQSVTSIANNAFNGNTELKNVKISEGITSIGELSFNGATNLEIVTLPNSLTTFGDGAFKGCSSLRTVTIPENVTTIGFMTFENCANLETINFNATNMADPVDKDGEMAFANTFVNAGINGAGIDVNIGENVTRIPNAMFAGLKSEAQSMEDSFVPTKIKTVNFAGNKVAEIGMYAFAGCKELISITIPESVTSIKALAFAYCTGLETINFNAINTSCEASVFAVAGRDGNGIALSVGENVTRIPEGMFYGDDLNGDGQTSPKLKTVAFAGDKVTEIGEMAFAFCKDLTNIVIPESVTTIGEYAFAYCTSVQTIEYNAANIVDKYDSEGNVVLSSLFLATGISGSGITLNVGENVTNIPAGLFVGENPDSTGDADKYISPKITNINFAENKLLSIGERAFDGCSELVGVNLPTGMTTIAKRAFYNCSGLTSITIPESVTTIGTEAFAGCTALQTINYNTNNIADSVDAEGNLVENKVFTSAGTAGSGITLNIGANVTKIPAGLFAGTINQDTGAIVGGPKFAAVNFGANVAEIGMGAFLGAQFTCGLVLPTGVTTIAKRAFYNCSGLASITIPESVTTIGTEAFAGCTALQTINYNTNNIADSVDAEGNLVENKVFTSAGTAGSGITLNIGANVTKIPAGLFAGTMNKDDGGVVGGLKFAAVNFGANVAEIGMGAFLGAQFAGTLVLPESVTTIGAEAFAFADVQGVEILGNVTRIEIGTFGYIPSLKSVVLPSTLKVIDAYSFIMCGLESLTIPGSVEEITCAFANCTNLTTLVVEEGCTAIGDQAFRNCTSLANVTLPNTLKTLDSRAFAECTALKSITIPGSVTTFVAAFLDCTGLETVVIEDGVTVVGNGAFQNCSSLKNVVIPDSVQSLGYSAFAGCSNLASITIGSNVSTVNTAFEPFKDCTSLAEVVIRSSYVYKNASSKTALGGLLANATTIKVLATADDGTNTYLNSNFVKKTEGDYNVYTPADEQTKAAWQYLTFEEYNDGYQVTSLNSAVIDVYIPVSYKGKKVISIADNAFSNENNINLTNVTISESVINIGIDAFNTCTSLASIKVEETNIKYTSKNGFGNEANCIIEKESKTLVVGCKNTIIPSDGSVTTIGYDAFIGCTGLTTITIPDCITNIVEGAFDSCGLINITIPSSVTSIDAWVFVSCTGLTSITIPENITAIGEGAFASCTNLATVIIENSDIYKAAVGTGHNNIGALLESATTVKVLATADDGSNTYLNSNFIKTTEGDYNVYVTVDQVYNFTLLDDGTYKFEGLKNDVTLTEVSIPATYKGKNVTQIGTYAFKNNTTLTAVTIPSSITKIFSFAFYRCTGLTEINYNAINAVDGTSGSTMFVSAGTEGPGITVTIGEGVERIPAYLLHSSSKVINVIIPNSVTSIGRNAFDYTGLTSVTIPSSVKNIDQYAFDGCTNLTTVIIESADIYAAANGVSYSNAGGLIENAKTIKILATADDGSNTYLNDVSKFIKTTETVDGKTYNVYSEPDEQTKAAWQYLTFEEYNDGYQVSGLSEETITDLYIPAFYNGKKVYGIKDGIYDEVGSGAFEDKGIISVTIAEGVEFIGEAAFISNSLTSAKIPNSIVRIGKGAFDWCESTLQGTEYNGGVYLGNDENPYLVLYLSKSNATSTTSVEIHSDTKFIYDNVFANFSKLTSVTIPNSVISIGSDAFTGCAKLETVIIESVDIYKLATSTTVAGGLLANAKTIKVLASQDEGNNAYLSSLPNYAEHLNGDTYNVYVIGQSLAECGIFEEYQDGYVVSGLSNQNVINVFVPATYNGKKVYGIKNMAPYYGVFDDNKYLKTIMFENGIEFIGDSAFNNCSNLASVVIPESVTYIGDYTFNGCINLTSVIIPNGVATIGEYAFSGCKKLTNIVLPSSITSMDGYAIYYCEALQGTEYNGGIYLGNAENPYFMLFKVADTSITSFTVHSDTKFIGSEAFNNCGNLTSVVIPNSIINIGNGAFYGCDALQGTEDEGAIYLGDDVNPYLVLYKAKDTSITSCTVHGDTRFICDFAFENCKDLSSVIIPNPDGIISIGDYAFMGCSNLTEFEIPASVTYIGYGAFMDCAFSTVTIPDGVKNINGSAFCGCANLVEVNLPNGIKSIRNGAFWKCSNLTSINIPESVLYIDGNVFTECPNLSTVVIESADIYKLITSKDDASSLFTNATMVKVLASIDDGSNTYLNSNFVKTTETVDGKTYNVYLTADQMFNYTLLNSDTYEVTGLKDGVTVTELNIPSTHNGKAITSIGSNAFKGNTTLTSVTIAEGVTSIGDYAFQNCTSLSEVIMPNSVTLLSTAAFNGCISLTSIIIPSGVNEFGNGVFSGCTNLNTITIQGNVTNFRMLVFDKCSNLTTVIIENDQMYKQLMNSYACSDLIRYATMVKVLATADDGTNTYLNNNFFKTTETVDGKIYNVYSAPDEQTKAAWQYLNFTETSDGSAYEVSGLKDTTVTDVFIPATYSGKNVTRIGNNAFFNCTNLASITIPNTVTSIGDSAFKSCSGLTSITIPSSVKSIETSAFWACENLTTVVIEGADVYKNLIPTSFAGDLLANATTIKVLATADDGSNTYLNENYELTVVGEYNVYTKTSFDVTFMDDDKTTVLGTEKVSSGSQVQTSLSPTKASTAQYNYTFVGWVDSSGKAVDLSTITSSTTVYAKYNQTTRLYAVSTPSGVTVKNGSTTLSNGAEVPYGTNLTISYSLSTGYHMTAFKVNDSNFTNGGTHTVTGAVNITFTQAANTATYNFYNGSTLVSTTTVRHGGNVTNPANPTKAADNTYTYSFDKWVTTDGGTTSATLTNVSVPTDGATVNVYASYTSTVREYSITIPSGVTVKRNDIVISSSTKLHYGEMIQVSYSLSKGYHLNEFWVTGASSNTTLGYQNYYDVKGDVSITFTQAINTATYKFYNGSTVVSTTTVSHGGNVTKPANPTKADDDNYTYTFEKWVTTDGGTTEANFTNVSVPTHGATVNVYASFKSYKLSAYTLNISGNFIPDVVSSTTGKSLYSGDRLILGDTLTISIPSVNASYSDMDYRDGSYYLLSENAERSYSLDNGTTFNKTSGKTVTVDSSVKIIGKRTSKWVEAPQSKLTTLEEFESFGDDIKQLSNSIVVVPKTIVDSGSNMMLQYSRRFSMLECKEDSSCYIFIDYGLLELYESMS